MYVINIFIIKYYYIYNSLNKVINKVKDIISKRGVDSIRLTGKVFRQFDSYDGKNKLNKEDFIFGLRECGIILQNEDLQIILDFFDKDKDEMINFTEFLIALRGIPNDRRQAIIDKAFLKFDKEGTGLIDVTEIRQVYNCSKHPKVVSAEMSEEQVFSLFLKNFNDRYNIGKIDRKEWNDYYSAVSYSIDNDDHFVIMMKTTWNLD
jgi:Ca2+-binding EF-hand superfamily protein